MQKTTMMRAAGAAVGVSMVLAGGAVAGPSVPTVIYSEIASDPTGMAPGLPGAVFDSFDRPYVSADGSSWIISASTDLATSMDEVIIVGSGMTGSVVVQEGVTVMPDGSLVGLIDRNMGVNNSGDYAFSTNTDGDSGGDEVIVKFNNGSGMFEFFAQEGQPVPGVPNEVFGTTLNSAGIMNSGNAFFRATATVGDLPADDDDFLFQGDNILAQANVTVPTGQAGGAMEAWDNFDSQDFYVSADGSTSLIQGDLQGDTNTDDVVAINNDVKIQEGSAIPGGSGVVDAISEAVMSPSGNWFARGDFENDIDWWALNGEVVAETGDDVPGGLPGETFSQDIFSSTFFTGAANGVGDFVFGATTSNPDEFADAVIVVNDEFVLLRQGDQIDLDGDGALDDVFLNVFNNEDMFLTDSGMLYFTATLLDAAGADLGQAFLTVQIPAPGAGLLLGLAGLAGLRRRRA